MRQQWAKKLDKGNPFDGTKYIPLLRENIG